MGLKVAALVIACAVVACSDQGRSEPKAAVGETSQSLTPPQAGAPAAAPSTSPSRSTARRVVWVMMKRQASLTTARAQGDWNARGRAVHSELTRAALTEQGALRAFLTQRGAKVRPFWIVNALRVEADQATIDAVAKRPDVAQVMPDRTYAVPPVQRGVPVQAINGTEWGLQNIRAPEAWDAFGSRGEGIVVANIDTGVQFDHPALQAQYRGSLPGGGYDHNYNWFDPAGVCGSPSLEPCDNNSHGTHTMGTMVGDDGDPGDNQIGVAPHAKWMAAKGCESSFCSLESLLASAEFILAPTDLTGQNPRPDLRPQIVNNSWGGGPGDPFFQAAVQSWVAAGIFPAFSAGNSGDFGCGTVGSPGDYPESYASGALDIDNNIAFFSSLGPAMDGLIKPNIAAPGVDVRSSVPGDDYDFFSGTSMASPHLAGTIALMWSAAPALFGDVDGTRALLDLTAIDTNDLRCGGEPENNNVWGEGRLDAFAAVDAAPRGPTGTLTGIASAADGSGPLAGVTIVAHNPDSRDRSATTAADGSYSLLLPIGSYDVTARLFGFISATATGVEITEGATTAQDFVLDRAPSFMVSGVVRDGDGTAVEGATVTILGTPLEPAVTDAAGTYVFPIVPAGTYSLRAAAGHCVDDATQELVVDGDENLDFALAVRFDAYGYSCSLTTPDYVEATNVVTELSDEDSIPVALPFPFIYYGQRYDTVYVNTNGLVHFVPVPMFSFLGFNTPIPDSFPPNAAIYALWDDLFVANGGSIRTEAVGSAPNRRFVIEWRDASFWDDPSRASFEIVLHEDGRVTLQYQDADSPFAQGRSATIGIEDDAGAVGLQYSTNQAAVETGTAIQYKLPPMGLVEGVVTDANDGLAIAGARVQALQGETLARATSTNAKGEYLLQLPAGSYAVRADREHYEAQQVTLNVAEDARLRADFSLRTGRATITPPTVQLVIPANQTRTRTLTLGNTGSLALEWSVSEAGGRKQVLSLAAKLPRNPNASPSARDTRNLYSAGVKPRGWTPDAVGDVLASFTPTGLGLAWGVGYTGDLWLSDVMARNNVEFDVGGVATGRSWPAGWSGDWPGDAAYDGSRDRVCQVAVGGDNGIHCWDPGSGTVTDSISGAFPWTQISQRGLAYREDDDSFYIGGWNEGVIYHVKGLSYPDKGAVIGSCRPSDPDISGLAWNGSMGVLWAATNSPTDTIYELNPDDCTVLSTVKHPTPGFNGAGIEIDAVGNLWTIGQNPNKAYLIESGVPAFSDVPWLTVTPSSGSLAAGATQSLTVTVDTTGLEPGVYLASIFVRSNSGREPQLRVPVSLIVTAYQQAVNAGGNAYTDTLGDPWAKDKAHSVGSWGFIQKGKVVTTTKAIAGTSDQPLYKSQRVDPYAYRYDSVPNGVYQVDIRSAELEKVKIGKRLYDVIVENTLVLPAHDIMYDAGALTADDHTFFVEVTDGRMDVRFVPRAGFNLPVINALRVTHRPDR
jgi:subtilisin family serine protease